MAGPVTTRARERAAKVFSPSRAVTRTISIWIRALPQLVAIAAIIHVPLLGVKWWVQGAPDDGSVRAVLSGGLAFLELTVFSRVIEGFAVLLVFQRLRREPADIGRSIQTGVRRIGTVFAISGITAVVLFAIPACGLIFAALGKVSRPGGSEFAIISFVLIWLIYSLVFFVPIPAALVEGLGPFAAFNRSRVLTNGCCRRIFGMWFMFLFITRIPTRLLQSLIVSISNPTTALLVEAAVDCLTASLTCVLPIVLYHDLRETKEGIGIEELLKVFD